MIKLLPILAIPLLVACAPATKGTQAIVIDSKPITRPELVLPNVDRFKAQDVEWIIITPENAEEVFAALQRHGRPVVLFGLDESGYKNVSVNTQEALRIIRQQQSVIAGYKQYYISVDGQIVKHNSEQ